MSSKEDDGTSKRPSTPRTPRNVYEYISEEVGHVLNLHKYFLEKSRLLKATKKAKFLMQTSNPRAVRLANAA